MCQQYREEIMALVDNELTPDRREQVVQHLHECPHCREEFGDYAHLAQMTRARAPFPRPLSARMEHYWDGVCEKLQTRTTWPVWAAASGGLILTAHLMFFGFPGSALARALAGVAFVSGLLVLGLSHVCCNCSRHTHHR